MTPVGGGDDELLGGPFLGMVLCGGPDDAATTSISTFMPWLQCKPLPQIKYRLPATVSAILVGVVVDVEIGLPVPQES